ncbi:MAG: FtsQ-type POTRA domain-containing protein [Clostridia bacterium]|nr:FtsQ-type POTRA domain-containing protein [Clostridia bacterium]
MQTLILAKKKKKPKNSGLGISKIHSTLIMLLTISSVYFFLQSPYFEINKIYVLGTEKLTISQVLELARIQPGNNILRLNNKVVEKSLATHPWIKDVAVEKKLPSTIKIVIQERQATAIVPGIEGFYIIDDMGVVLAKVANLAEVVLPIITNVSLQENIYYGEQIDREDFLTALEVISSLPEEIKTRASEVSLGDVITVYFSGGLEIKIGTRERIQHKLTTLSEIFTNTDKEVLDRIKYIDLRFNGPPVIRYDK